MFYGVDLAELVASNRYVAVEDYFRRLPAYSRTWSAMLRSPEEVAAMIDMGFFDQTEVEDKGIDFSEHTPLVEAVYMVVDELRMANHKRPRRVPRPKSDVVDLVRLEKDTEYIDTTAALFGF